MDDLLGNLTPDEFDNQAVDIDSYYSAIARLHQDIHQPVHASLYAEAMRRTEVRTDRYKVERKNAPWDDELYEIYIKAKVKQISKEVHQIAVEAGIWDEVKKSRPEASI